MTDIYAHPGDHLQKFKTQGDETDGSSGVTPYVEADVTVSSGSLTISGGSIQITSGSVAVTTDPVPVRDKWRVSTVSDEDANDNDKVVLETSEDEEDHILWILVEYTSGSVAGTRQLVIEVLDSEDDLLARIIPSQTQAASLTREYMFAPALSDILGFRDTSWLMTPIPSTLLLSAGDQLRVYDNNAVSSEDDIVVHVQIANRSVA